MRIDPDFAPPPAPPQPGKDGPANRRDVETGARPKPKGQSMATEAQDYDDGAWM